MLGFLLRLCFAPILFFISYMIYISYIYKYHIDNTYIYIWFILNKLHASFVHPLKPDCTTFHLVYPSVLVSCLLNSVLSFSSLYSVCASAILIGETMDNITCLHRWKLFVDTGASVASSHPISGCGDGALPASWWIQKYHPLWSKCRLHRFEVVVSSF